MSRSKRFLNGLIFGYSHQALVMVVGLWLTRFLLRFLGQHDYGLWLVALQVLTYLALADFGILALLPRAVAYETGRAGSVQAAKDLAPTIGQTALVVLCQTPIVALAASLTWFLLPKEWAGLHGPIGLVMAGFTLMFPFRLFAAVLEGLQEQAFVIRATMLGWCLSTAVSVGAVLAGMGLYSLAVGWLVAQVFSAAACAHRLWKHFPEVLPSRLSVEYLSGAVRQLGRGFWISVGQIGQVLMAGSDILIIGKLLGPALTVPFACTGKLANVLANQPQMLMHLAVPALSELKTGSSKDHVHRVTVSLSQGMMLLSGAVFCVVLTVNRAFVEWWVGPERYAGFALTTLILIQVLLRHFNLTFSYAVFCFGYERRLAIIALIDGAVTAGAMLLLVPRLGYFGATIGSILGVCLVSLPVNLITLATELRMPMARLAFPLWPWFWRFALVAAACYKFASFWTPHGFVQIAASAVAAAILYCVILAPATLRTALGPYLRAAIVRLLAVFQRQTAPLNQ